DQVHGSHGSCFQIPPESGSLGQKSGWPPDVSAGARRQHSVHSPIPPGACPNVIGPVSDAKEIVMTAKASTNTLVPGFKSADPYSWLSGNDNYELPAEWLGLLADIPEKHSARILASIDEESFARYAVFVNTVFED